MDKSGKVATFANLLLFAVLLIIFFLSKKDYDSALDYTNRKPSPDKPITCNNFKNQKNAQDFYKVHGDYGLDNDRDGIVCENLK